MHFGLVFHGQFAADAYIRHGVHHIVRLFDGADSLDCDSRALPHVSARSRHRIVCDVSAVRQLDHRTIHADDDRWIGWRHIVRDFRVSGSDLPVRHRGVGAGDNGTHAGGNRASMAAENRFGLCKIRAEHG